jgi:hypothetical protein
MLLGSHRGRQSIQGVGGLSHLARTASASVTAARATLLIIIVRLLLNGATPIARFLMRSIHLNADFLDNTNIVLLFG